MPASIDVGAGEQLANSKQANKLTQTKKQLNKQVNEKKETQTTDR